MTGTPDAVSPLLPGLMPGLVEPCYRAYPVVDHIADKVAAILERHGDHNRPSTRYKDLVDLVALTTNASVPADDQQRALDSEADRRVLTLPARFDVPEPSQWRVGYSAEARRAVDLSARTLADALAAVRPFVEPLLNHTADGTWHPDNRRWTAGSDQ